MRCDNCEYRRYIYSDDIYECEFGFEGENSKGECGCRYNRKTLNKFKRESIEEDIKIAEYFMNKFKNNMGNEK